ncbi:uncharacterized protein LOC106069331 isoform X3 [Biomphalaria glabrata]|uniref:Uncharacterized protein LOC106069331 isoform X3 n=1 Tax=Biomphalaria glabrata TaxID=6526 RepID=A0A9W3B427_BIOGL|nr:uncharacterized protein LOC106069331 isoform X3 [Biomphalaria glabrata]
MAYRCRPKAQSIFFLLNGLLFASFHASVVDEPLPINMTFNIEPSCYEPYKNVMHLLPDGTKTQPYLPYKPFGDNGKILECETEIPNGKFIDCDYKPYYVSTKCTFSCNSGYHSKSTNVSCLLMKPLSNVTAKWWPIDPCQPREFDVTTVNTTPDEPPGSAPVVTPSSPPDELPSSAPIVTPFEASGISVLFTIVIVLSSLLGAVALMLIFFILYKRKAEQTPRTYKMSEQELAFGELPSCNRKDANDNIGNAGDSEFFRDKQVQHFKMEEENPTEASTFLSHPSDKVDIYTDKDVKKGTSALLHGYTEDKLDRIEKEINNLQKTLIYDEKQESADKTFSFLDEIECPVKSLDSCCPIQVQGKCDVNIKFLLNQNINYKGKLRGELELIDGRPLAHSLAGYARCHWKDLGYASVNQVKVIEESFKQRTDDKASDEFLQVMSQRGYTIGEMLEYFYQEQAHNVVDVVLEVHKDCHYCNQLGRK